MSGIVVVGAGPAGMAAAVAARHRSEVTVIDDNPGVGGQVWRGGDVGNDWFKRFAECGAKVLTGARVIAGDARERTLLVEMGGIASPVRYTKLILATGARELFLPFPGWTLPNVMGLGGLQALVKSGLPVAGKRVVVAGSGPLLLAVAAYLKKHGALLPLIAEQASLGSLARFATGLAAHPGKLWQAWRLRPGPYLADCWIEAAFGKQCVERVRVRRANGRVWDERCDYLANAYGFVANVELATLLGCRVDGGVVRVDEWQQSSVAGVFCAGEMVGIGGVDTALIEGEIAGLAATGQTSTALTLRRRLQGAKRFAGSLAHTFRLRDDLRYLAQADTVICRCEDVTLARLRTADSWRSAKLHERCGMGPCQGRICGPATQFILGWEPSSIRPPIFPARLDSLLQENLLK